LRVSEIFFSLQGEGIRAGTANIFVRFTGCNLRCAVESGPLSPGGFDCDTEFASGRTMAPDELVRACLELVAKPDKAVGVILTGGEPLLQVTVELVKLFQTAGFWPICCETNGTIDPQGLGLDWVTLSPKVAEHAVKVKYCNEIKYVRHVGQGIPKPSAAALYYLISPAFTDHGVDRATLAACIALVKENPTWRLSVQQHKSWSVR
jgi:organic radical activating enzyme